MEARKGHHVGHFALVLAARESRPSRCGPSTRSRVTRTRLSRPKGSTSPAEACGFHCVEPTTLAVALQLDLARQPHALGARSLRGDDRRGIQARHDAQAHFRGEGELRERHRHLAAVGGQGHEPRHLELGAEGRLGLDRRRRLRERVRGHCDSSLIAMRGRCLGDRTRNVGVGARDRQRHPPRGADRARAAKAAAGRSRA